MNKNSLPFGILLCALMLLGLPTAVVGGAMMNYTMDLWLTHFGKAEFQWYYGWLLCGIPFVGLWVTGFFIPVAFISYLASFFV